MLGGSQIQPKLFLTTPELEQSRGRSAQIQADTTQLTQVCAYELVPATRTGNPGQKLTGVLRKPWRRVSLVNTQCESCSLVVGQEKELAAKTNHFSLWFPLTVGHRPEFSHKHTLIMSNNAATCAFCGTTAQAQQLRFCSGCRQRKYCNEACQREAWRAGHKEECKRLRARASSSSPSSSSSSSSAPAAAAAAASTSRSAGGEGGGDPPSSSPSSASDPTAPVSLASSSRTTRAKTPKKKNGIPTANATNGPAASAEAEHTNPTHGKTHAAPDDDNAPKKKRTGVVRSLPKDQRK